MLWLPHRQACPGKAKLVSLVESPFFFNNRARGYEASRCGSIVTKPKFKLKISG